jgi:hypothetical protein
MPLTPLQVDSLFSGLVRRGWRWKGDWIYAPHDSIWLSRSSPARSDPADSLERIEGRLRRIANFEPMDSEAYSDTALLVEVLREIAAGWL